MSVPDGYTNGCSEPPWPAPSEQAFDEIGEQDPERLKAWVLSGELGQADLSFAAEVLGKHGGRGSVPTLLSLLDDPSPLVREGAVYGLGFHLGQPGVSERLRTLVEHDESPGVREAARILRVVIAAVRGMGDE